MHYHHWPKWEITKHTHKPWQATLHIEYSMKHSYCCSTFDHFRPVSTKSVVTFLSFLWIEYLCRLWKSFWDLLRWKDMLEFIFYGTVLFKSILSQEWKSFVLLQHFWLVSSKASKTAFFRRLGSMLKAFLEPKNISEEQLLNWEQKECPWSSDEFTNSDPDGLASDVRETLCESLSLHTLWCRGNPLVPRFVSFCASKMQCWNVEAEDSGTNPWVAIQDGWDQGKSPQAECRQQPSCKDLWESNQTSWEHQVYGTCPNRIFTWKVHEWHGQGREWLDSNATTHRAIRRATCQAEQWCVQAGFADCHENQSSSEKGKVLSWRAFLQDGHRSFAALKIRFFHKFVSKISRIMIPFDFCPSHSGCVQLAGHSRQKWEIRHLHCVTVLRSKPSLMERAQKQTIIQFGCSWKWHKTTERSWEKTQVKTWSNTRHEDCRQNPAINWIFPLSLSMSSTPAASPANFHLRTLYRMWKKNQKHFPTTSYIPKTLCLPWRYFCCSPFFLP